MPRRHAAIPTGGGRSDGGGGGGLCRASQGHPYCRSRLRLGRLPHLGVSAAAGGADRGGPRHGENAWRRARRDLRGAADRRHPARQYLRRRHQPGVGRDRQARAVATFGASVRSALLAGAHDPHRQQSGRRGFLGRAEQKPRPKNGSELSIGAPPFRRSGPRAGMAASMSCSAIRHT